MSSSLPQFREVLLLCYQATQAAEGVKTEPHTQHRRNQAPAVRTASGTIGNSLRLTRRKRSTQRCLIPHWKRGSAYKLDAVDCTRVGEAPDAQRLESMQSTR